MYERSRCLTGIEGLDDALHGGVPVGNVVLITGSCGTGKSTLSIEFLVNGGKQGENGVYISVTEPTSKVLENMKTFKFFDESLIENNRLFLIDLAVLYDRLGLLDESEYIEDIDALIWALGDVVRALDVKRAVIDSITAVCTRLKEKSRIREFIFRVVKAFTSYGVTTLLVSEVGAGTVEYSVYGVEEAIADGIIVLSDVDRGGDLLRTLQIVKMRGTVHSRAKYVMDLTPDGIIIVPLLKRGVKPMV
jgi:circadian clock protein KaiC